MKDNPTLEDALDGLIHVVGYCEDCGMGELAEEAADLYQRVAGAAPYDEWEEPLECCECGDPLPPWLDDGDGDPICHDCLDEKLLGLD